MKKILYLFLTVSLIFSSCKKEEGCTDTLATNYNADAEEEDGSCTYTLVGLWDVDSYIISGTEYVGTSIVEMYIVVNNNLTTETNTFLADATTLSIAGTMSISGTTLIMTNSEGDSTTWTITLFNGSNLNINCADLGQGLGAASMRLTK